MREEMTMTNVRLIFTVGIVVLGVGCGGDSQSGGSNDNGGPVGYFDYFTESASLEAGANVMEIVALYAPNEAGLACSNLPISEVRYRLSWSLPRQPGNGTWAMVGHVPISREEFELRWEAVGGQDKLRAFEFVSPSVSLRLRDCHHQGLLEGTQVQCGEGYEVSFVTADGTEIGDLRLLLGSCGQPQCRDGLCDANETPESCTRDCGCGDGMVAAPEVCDGTDFAGLTCEDYGFTSGKLVCSACVEVITDDCTTLGP
jgi:hypothetical protein